MHCVKSPPNLYPPMNKTLNKKEGVVALVSGGVDSMVMLHTLHSQTKKLAVLHINYQKRGLASDGDQECVEKWCSLHNVPVISHKVEYSGVGNFQEWAREIRYHKAREYAQKLGYSTLATAHHQSDVAETFLMNLLRGSGLEGLVPFKPQDGLIRPLLQWTRQEILDYAKEHGISWREDASNAENDFTRNQIRNQLIPLMEEIDPRFSKSLPGTLSRLEEAWKQLQRETEKDLQRHLETSDHRQKISIEILRSHPHLQRALAQRWEVPQDLIVKRMEGTIYSTEHYCGLEIQNANPWLVMRVYQESEVLIDKSTSKVELNGMTLGLKPHEGSFDPRLEAAQFDWSTLTFPLILRPWRSGDFFYPSGFGKKKTISQFLTDQKYAPELRREVLVLTSNNQVIWVVGMRQDQRFLLGNQSKMGYIARAFVSDKTT